jgi:predicted nucleic acid-binding Zn ribbon protein
MPRAGGGRVKGPRRLDSALDSVLESLGVAQAVERHAVFREWEERLGPEIARAAHPHRVDGETLIVRVTTSAWLNELSLRQGELLKRLNAGRRRSSIRRLVFRLDPEAKG